MQSDHNERDFVITIMPSGKKLSVNRGTLLSEALLAGGYFSSKALCSGIGVCGGCAVYIVTEKMKRLVKACQTFITADYRVEIPVDDSVPILTHGRINADTSVGYCKALQLSLPDSVNGGSDWERLFNAAAERNIDLGKPTVPILQQLAAIPGNNSTVTVVFSAEGLLSIRAQDMPGKIYGIAFDLGTTTVVGYLYDLTDGNLIATASILNPQVSVGADVISRIQFATIGRDEAKKLADMIRQGFIAVIDQLVQAAQINRAEIYQVTVAGNTCMQQLLLEISVSGLRQSPFHPVTTDPVYCRAAELGLPVNEMAAVYCLPCIGGFVGGDTVGMLVTCLPDQKEKGETIFLAIDIGTNCEIVLCTPKIRIACSAAAGPAFEGGAISQGMKASAGAIDKVRIEDDVNIHVIGDTVAQGVCGSGLVDVMAEMLESGIIDFDGRMLTRSETASYKLNPRLMERLTMRDGIPAFLLSEGRDGQVIHSVAITQLDVRQLQLAKAAIQTSIRILTDMADIHMEDIHTVFLAGAFGNYIDLKNAAKIGIVPDVLTDKVVSLGNAAGTGAGQVLLSEKARKKAEWIAQSTLHVSLADHPDFQTLFLESLSFTHTQNR